MQTPTYCVPARLLRAGYVLALTAVLTTAGRAETVEERLAKIEKQMSSLAAENASLRKELGYSKEGKPPTLVTPSGKETKLVLGGFIHANGEFGDSPDARWNGISNRFLLRRARLNVTASFANDFLAKIESDFGANTLSSSTGIRAQLTDGYVQWNKYPAAVVRAGQFKTPFGYEQLASDTKIYTIERSLPNDRLTASRQIGMGLSGDFVGKRLSYAVGAFNGTGVNTSANDNDQFMWVGRVSGVVIDGQIAGLKSKLSFGTNAFTTKDNGTFTGKRDGVGVDAQLAVGPAEFWAEWLQNKNTPTTGTAVKADGYSLLGSWKFGQMWQGVVRYEEYDSNTATTATTTDLWTLGVNYLIKGDDLKLSLNYLIGDQPGTTLDGNRLIARLQVVF